MWHEPNCELPWDLYLDWLADQGFDELRDINFYSLTTGCFTDANDENGDIYHHYLDMFLDDHDDFNGNASDWSVEFKNFSDGDGSRSGTWGVGNYETMDEIEFGGFA